jgi:hypothetical protein
MIVLPLLPTVRQVPGATSSGSVAKLPGSVPVVLGGFVTGIPLDGCGVVPDSLACLQSDRRSARLAQWWSAHSRGKTREGCQEIKIGEVGYQAQGELTAVTMIRRYNRFGRRRTISYYSNCEPLVDLPLLLQQLCIDPRKPLRNACLPSGPDCSLLRLSRSRQKKRRRRNPTLDNERGGGGFKRPQKPAAGSAAPAFRSSASLFGGARSAQLSAGQF